MAHDLLVFEAPSVTAGFKTLNSLANVELVDAEPIGEGRFLILARGEAENLRSYIKGAIDAEVIEHIDQSVLDAIFSLAPNALDESLVVIETETAVGLISISQSLVRKHELRPIEIKIRKSGPGGGYGYFTGAKQACELAAADARVQLTAKVRKGLIEVFEKPNELLKSLFEV